MFEVSIPTLLETELTTKEIAYGWHHLYSTRALLVEAVSGLSSSQLNYKHDNKSWSIAENLEHLVIYESRVHAIIRNMSNAAEVEFSGKPREMDEIVLEEVANRSIKVKAPTAVCPAHRWNGNEALQQFISGRDQTIQLLGAPLLRGRFMPHPFFGPWDGYQWLLAVASHSARHTAQICEVKKDNRFPQGSIVATEETPCGT